MRVPLVDVNSQNAPFQEQFESAFREILSSGGFLLGAHVEQFEREVENRYGVRHAIAVSSGTDALVVSLLAVGVKAGDEVICPGFTFYATAGAISQIGATPVFADVCPICYNIDVSQAESLVTEKTRAVIPVHLFGQAADMDSVLEFSSRHKLAVIEDAAQAIGAQYRGQFCGSIGDVGTFSFYPTKNLGALGDAGMVVTNDDHLAEQVRMIRVHGSKERYKHEMTGGNFRLDAIQGAALSIKLASLDKYESKRTKHANLLTKELSKLKGVKVASESDCCCPFAKSVAQKSPDTLIVLPVCYSHNKHVWNQYTIRVKSEFRDQFKQRLAEQGVASEVYYPIPVHKQMCYQSAQNLSYSELLSTEVLSLPIAPELTEQQIFHVVHVIQGILNDYLTTLNY